MTDKQILDEVYALARQHIDREVNESAHNHTAKLIASFIEQEWQGRDEQELVDQYNRNRKPEDYIVDVAEIERHRGLVIGEDGTVKELI